MTEIDFTWPVGNRTWGNESHWINFLLVIDPRFILANNIYRNFIVIDIFINQGCPDSPCRFFKLPSIVPFGSDSTVESWPHVALESKVFLKKPKNHIMWHLLTQLPCFDSLFVLFYEWLVRNYALCNFQFFKYWFLILLISTQVARFFSNYDTTVKCPLSIFFWHTSEF